MSGGEDDSLVDVPTAPITNLLPTKKKVKPWHAPRKQWVREFQWNAQIIDLIDKLGGGSLEQLSYLSLPGTDLLDVRSLWGVCSDRAITLKYLGFNDPEMESLDDITALNISQAEMLKRRHVHPRSTVVKDRLEQLAVERSVAQEALRQFGAVDVINLDLTNCVVQHVPNLREADYYRAMHHLLDHQRRTRAAPFLFFLTTRVNAEQLDPTAFRTLLEVLLQNYVDHPGFVKKMISTFGVEERHVRRAHSHGGFAGIAECLHSVFGVSFGKWLLKLLMSGRPAWIVEMQDSCAYTIKEGDTPDMFSYAYLCRPVERPPMDQFGLSRLVQEPGATITEGMLAERLVEGVDRVFDLDALLWDDDQLRRQVVRSATELMRQANYDPQAYSAAAEEQLRKVAGWLRVRYPS